ncbi:dopamine D2-like receptor [Mytilus californianus]|uniref:dopamine D2-like receptor n=1 Tax=Mytilus californianus TaxID=6549 RepID=UPI002246E298|nr:dopamine D2-like receptor [Mytilus californianus]
MSWSQVNNTEMMSTNYPTNITNSEELLRTLNDQLALRYLPVIIYMILLIFTGLFGNVLVIIVYVRKKTKSSLDYFIINLAALDLLTVVIGMPTEIVDLRYPIMFNAPVACKALRTVESMSVNSSIITLMALAVDRYNRICKYGKQMTIEKAKRICVIAIVIGIVTCWPAAIVLGMKTKDVGIPGVYGVDCSTDDSMKGTKYPLVHYGLLFLYFVVCVVFFTVIYTKIILFIRRQKKKGNISENPYLKKTNELKSSTAKNSFTDIENDQNHGKEIQKHKTQTDCVHQKLEENKSPHKIRAKTTLMLGIVTIVFVLSFLPFLTVMLIRYIIKHFENNLSEPADVFYKFCSKSYFINNSVNPTIYSFMNVQFRRDVKQIFSKKTRCFGKQIV